MKQNCAFLLVSAAVLIAGASLCPAQASAKRPLTNGDFEDSPVGQAPAGWTNAYPTGLVTVASDGRDTFLRLSSSDSVNAGVAQVVEVPPMAKTVAVLGRMRGKPQNGKKEKRAAVEVALRYKDAKGANLSAAVVASGNSPNWHTFRRQFTLPAGCTKVEVLARSLFAVGTFDFDEVRVEFK